MDTEVSREHVSDISSQSDYEGSDKENQQERPGVTESSSGIIQWDMD